MEIELMKSILFDLLDGIPPSGNESKVEMLLSSRMISDRSPDNLLKK